MHDDAAFSEEELQILQRLEHKNEVFEASADPLSTWQSGWSEGWQEGARDEVERIIGNLLQLHAERELISQATGWSQAEIEAVRVQAEKEKG